MCDIDAWVLNAACGDLARWRDAGLQPGRLALNLSAVSLGDPAGIGPEIVVGAGASARVGVGGGESTGGGTEESERDRPDGTAESGEEEHYSDPTCREDKPLTFASLLLTDA